MARRVAGRSGRGVVSPYRDEHHILDELTDSRQPVRQRRVLARHVPIGADQP